MCAHIEYPTPPLTLLLLLVFSQAIAQPQNIEPPLREDPCTNTSYDKTMAAVLVILVLGFFLMGFTYIYNRECGEQRFRGRSNVPTPTGTCLEVPPRGLDAETIEKFPKFVYSKVKGCKIWRLTLECAVCLNEFAHDEMLRLIPKCSHVFHHDCIDAWLVNHSTCPVCRANLLPIPDDVSSSIAIDISEPYGLESSLPEPETNHNIDVVSQVDDCTRVVVTTDSRRDNFDEVNGSVWSKSMRFGNGRLFPRSYSVGDLIVRRYVDCERFTLRLPEELQYRLVKSVTEGWGVTMQSGRRVYRTRSVGRSYLH